jgi:hypothetical protein
MKDELQTILASKRSLADIFSSNESRGYALKKVRMKKSKELFRERMKR